jgi:hypothetical protein
MHIGWRVLLEHVFGEEVVTGGTDVAYNLQKEFSKSFSLHRGIGNGDNANFAELMRGCVSSEATFSLTGENETLVTLTGFGADVLRAGRTQVVSDTGTVVTVTEGHGEKFDVGMFIDVGDQTGLLISAITGDELTVPAHTATSAADPVVPSICTISQTFQADSKPVSGILGSVELAEEQFEVISAELTVNNNVQMHNDRYGLDKADGFHLSNRSVEGSITIRLNDANVLEVFKTRANEETDLELVVGTAPGSIFEFNLPHVNFEYTAIPGVEVEDMQVTLPFMGMGDDGEDELSLVMK